MRPKAEAVPFQAPNLLETPGHETFARLALREALDAYEDGEVPVGAVAVLNNEVIARARNQIERLKDATAHAEMIAMTQAAVAVGDWRLDKVVLYVTKEPCAMCAGGMVNSRLGRLVYGMPDPNYGAAGSALNVTGFTGHLWQVPAFSFSQLGLGELEATCKGLFQRFFRERRLEKKNRSAD